MANVIRRIGVRMWRTLTVVFGVLLYAVATSNQAYQLTSPTALSIHAILRKTYALLAFALLGFLLERAKVRGLRGSFAVAIAIGLYSYAIEIGQIVIDHTTETFNQHSFDVASGAVGGLMGAFVARLIAGSPAAERRRDGAIIVVSLLVLAWAFTVTYG
jgi:hypothetical protein